MSALRRVARPAAEHHRRLLASAVPETRAKKVVAALQRYVKGLDADGAKVEMAGAGQVAVSQSMFKVTAGSHRFGVKLMDESAVGVDLSKFVDSREASLRMSAAGLTPKILGWDDSVIVREYVGKVIKLKDLNGPEDFSRLGTAFAKLHSLKCPQEWMQIPSTAHGGYANYFRQFSEQTDDAEIKKSFEDAINLMDQLPDAGGILSRLVLTHSDAKPGNVLRYKGDLVFIDLDMVALRPAYYDLTYAMFMWGGTAGDMVLDPSEPGSWFRQPEVRRAFASAYLAGCGYSNSRTDIDNFLFDLEACAPHMMMYFAFVSHWLSLNPALPEAVRGIVGGLRRTYLSKVHLVNAEILQASTVESRRQGIASNGVLTLIE
eukprot:TRINITY_DN62183_c0_g1_i1.p1 TRINITY_DN62183_c0_g1~~TRINITY_DN62183_c0_g1_i1.p1  ORF type:complete len:375 (-),score=75.50 TRINITY_DN62183_c0_g1_i1:179-1303(-)